MTDHDDMQPLRRRDHRPSRITTSVVSISAAVLLAAVLTTAALAGCGAGAAQVGGSASPAASPAATTQASAAASPTPSPSPTPTPPPLDKPTKNDPLRIYFGGDSLSGMPGIMLEQLTARNRLAKVNPDYVESSRLTYGDPVDWPAHLKQQMSSGHYDVGVFMIGANDSGMPMLVDGTSVMYPKKKWLDEYASRAKQITTIMLRSGVKRVYWVGMPIMPSSSDSKKMRDLNKLFEDVAASSPDVVYVDSYDLLSKKSGGFNAALRSGDGIHYTNEGATVVAEAVWKAIKADWQKR